MSVPAYTRLTDEQILQYNRWRMRYQSAEEAAIALCPDYLKDRNTLIGKLNACYIKRLMEGMKANPPDRVVCNIKALRETDA